MSVAFTVAFLTYTVTTIVMFSIHVTIWYLERDYDPDEATHHARRALTAWAWPIVVLDYFRQMKDDAQ